MLSENEFWQMLTTRRANEGKAETARPAQARNTVGETNSLGKYLEMMEKVRSTINERSVVEMKWPAAQTYGQSSTIEISKLAKMMRHAGQWNSIIKRLNNIEIYRELEESLSKNAQIQQLFWDAGRKKLHEIDPEAFLRFA